MADSNRSTPVRVLVYSNDSDTRSQVILALGKRPDPQLPTFEYLEVATAPVVHERMGAGGIDVAVLDGEAAPTGGLGIAKQLKDELAQCPPLLVLTGRRDDAWLANWSRAEASVSHPIDPFELTRAIVGILRDRSSV